MQARKFLIRGKFRELGIVSLRSEQRRDIRLSVTCATVLMERLKRLLKDRRTVLKLSNTILRLDRSGQ